MHVVAILRCECDSYSFISYVPSYKWKVYTIVNFVYNKCDLVHSLASLAGKILHWSCYGKVDILCCFPQKSKSYESKSWTCFHMPNFIILKVDKNWTVQSHYKILCFFPFGCVQIVPVVSPGLVALL